MAAVKWNTAVSGNWTTAADWSTGSVPGAADDATIGVGAFTYTVSVTTPITVNSITISDPDATLLAITVPGEAETVTTNLNNFGAVEVDTSGGVGGSLTVDGTLFNMYSGTVRLVNAALAIAGGLANGGRADIGTTGIGGSSLTVAGTLTNRSGRTVSIGNSAIATAVTVTAGGLANDDGTIEVTGGAAQASLSVAAAAPSTFYGTLDLAGDALVAFASGGIAAIASGSEISLDGSQSRVALSSAPTSNSALTGLAGNLGTLVLENGAALIVSGGFVNSGEVEIDTIGSGGSSFTVAGTLTNRSGRTVSIGNSAIATAAAVTAGGLANDDGTIEVTGGAAQASLSVAAAAPSIFYGTLDLAGNALVEFASGGITVIGKDSLISLDGSQSSDSALTGLAGNVGALVLENGAVLAVTGGFVNRGELEIDIAGNGGSSLTVPGTLTNGPGGTIGIGNSAMETAVTVTAGGLANDDGTIQVNGGAAQATLNIEAAAPSTFYGTLQLGDNALVEFAGGGITAIAKGSEISLGRLTGYQSRVALSSDPTSNSALTGLASNAGDLFILGSPLTLTGGFVNSGEAEIGSFTVAGTLTNSGIFDSGGTGTAAALVNTGTLTVGHGSLNIAAAAPSTLTGAFYLYNGSLLEFASGGITAIGSGATLQLVGNGTRVALSSDPTSNSALTGLASNAGNLDLEDGAALAISGGFVNTGQLLIDTEVLAGGSSLTVGGMLTNSDELSIGNSFGNDFFTTQVSAAALANTGSVHLADGYGTNTAVLTLTDASSDSGSITISHGGVLALGGTLTVSGSLLLNGTISGGTLSGTGTIEIAPDRTGTLNGVTVADGTTILVAGTRSTLVVDGAVFDGSAIGNGRSAIDFGQPGTDSTANISDFGTIGLADGGTNTLTLSDANFAGVTGASITVVDGNDGNTVDASSVTGSNRIVVFGGPGAEVLTGGAGNDIFEFTAANLAATDTVNGGGGTNYLLMTTAGTVAAGGVSGVEVYHLANGGANTLTLTNANFAGVAGASITVVDGNDGNTVNASALSAPNRVVVVGGSGAEMLKGGAGNDIFEFTVGDLTDADTIAGGAGSNTLVFTTAGTIAASAFSQVSGIEAIHLANGTNSLTLSSALVAASEDKRLMIEGGTGDDTINDAAVLAANTVAFNGEGGNDSITGGRGANVYGFNNLPGTLDITNEFTGGTAAHGDLEFGPGVTDQDLWFVQSGNNLVAEVVGTSEAVTVNGWFGTNASAQVSEIEAGGLKLDSQVAQLVSAMATYSANNPTYNPTSSGAVMPTDPTLQNAIAASWHS